ncbi:hypothetical protein SDC9_142355 [bioreactor metagenome]|uniref:Uncharacterized protein n=1 Tax=bioreactor metagenome TaxID=1076179 RepID=A0A645E3Q8_9ZZZZ
MVAPLARAQQSGRGFVQKARLLLDQQDAPSGPEYDKGNLAEHRMLPFGAGPVQVVIDIEVVGQMLGQQGQRCQFAPARTVGGQMTPAFGMDTGHFSTSCAAWMPWSEHGMWTARARQARVPHLDRVSAVGGTRFGPCVQHRCRTGDTLSSCIRWCPRRRGFKQARTAWKHSRSSSPYWL